MLGLKLNHVSNRGPMKRRNKKVYEFDKDMFRLAAACSDNGYSIIIYLILLYKCIHTLTDLVTRQFEYKKTRH